MAVLVVILALVLLTAVIIAVASPLRAAQRAPRAGAAAEAEAEAQEDELQEHEKYYDHRENDLEDREKRFHAVRVPPSRRAGPRARRRSDDRPLSGTDARAKRALCRRNGYAERPVGHARGITNPLPQAACL